MAKEQEEQKQDASEQGKQKRARHRSRNYPALTLQEAVQRAKELYEHIRNHYAPLAVVVGHWDYSPKSSSALRAVSAVMQYGLLEEGEGSGTNKQLRLSQLAKTILHHHDAKEIRKALAEAALKPALHSELWGKYGSSLPSDKVLIWELTQNSAGNSEGTLNDRVVPSFLENYKSTLEFAGLTESDILDDRDSEMPMEDDRHRVEEFRESDTKTPPKSQERSAMPDTASLTGGVFDLPIPLPTGEQAILRMPKPLAEETYEFLKKALANQLDLFKDSLTVRRGATKDGSDADD